MKITIDTNQDSHTDIKKVIRMLQHLVGEQASSNYSESSESSYGSSGSSYGSNDSSGSSFGSSGYGSSDSSYGSSGSSYGSSDSSYGSSQEKQQSRDIFASSDPAPSMFSMFDSAPATPEPVQTPEPSYAQQSNEPYSSHVSSEENAAESASVLSMFDPPTPKPSASSLLRETNYAESSTDDDDDDTFEYHIETY